MNVSERLTGLMNAVRGMSGVSSKLDVDDATNIAGSAGQWGVRVPNLMPKGIQSGQPKIAATKTTADLRAFNEVSAHQTYSATAFVENAPAAVHLRLFVWNKNWQYSTSTDGPNIAKGQSGTLTAQVTTPDDMQGPGIIRCSLILEQNAKEDVVINYKDLMVNVGDYAPYTTATKPYTVDSLAERITALENKVGGG